MNSQKTVRLEVYGKVQGVFFRATTREEATTRGVCGWVRNRRDGSVEAVMQGPEEAVDAMVEWAHRGSPAAKVQRVEVEVVEEAEAFDGFEVRR